MKKTVPFLVIVLLLSAGVSQATPITPASTDLNTYMSVPFYTAITYTDDYPRELEGKYIKTECRFDRVKKHKPFDFSPAYKTSEWVGPIVLKDNSGNHISRAVIPLAKADVLRELKSGDRVTIYARLETHLVGVWTASTIHYDSTPYLIIYNITKSSM
jgi:hypothetical protein